MKSKQGNSPFPGLRGWRDRCVVAFVPAVALLTIFGPIVSRREIIGGMDFLNLIYPQVAYACTVFSQGFIPLWNWFTWGGSPLLAAWQSALCYPPTWLAMVIGLPWGLQLGIYLHLVVAAVGAERLAKSLFSLSTPGSLIAGIAYAGSGFFLGHIEQVNTVAALAWTPWILEAVFRILTEAKGGHQLILTVALSLLAGHPQHLQLLLLLTAIALICLYFVLVVVDRAAIDYRAGLMRLGLVLGGLLVALSLSAVQVAPSLELAHVSERVWPYADPFSPHFRWAHVPAFFAPRYFNRLAGTSGQPIGFTEEGVYLGIISLALIVSFWFGLYHKREWRFSFFFTLLAFIAAFLFALGPEGRLAPVLAGVLPFLTKLRGCARALNLVVLLLSCWAAAGFDVLLSRVARPARQLLAVVVPAVLTLDLALTHRPELESLLVPREAITEIPALFRFAKMDHTSPRRIYRFMANDSDLYLDHRVSAVAERIVRLQPNLNMPAELPLVDGYEEGLLPTWPYGNFLRQFNRNLRNETLDAPLLALMGVEYVLTEYPVTFDADCWEKICQTSSRPLTNTRLTVWRNRIPTGWFLAPKELIKSTSSTVSTASGREAFKCYSPDLTAATDTPHKINTNTTWLPHAVANASKADFERAVRLSGFRVQQVLPNGLLVTVLPSAPNEVVFCGVISPGWKWSRNSMQPFPPIGGFGYKPFVVLRNPSAMGTSGEVMTWRLHYAPASYRIGLFISLLTASGWLVFASRSLVHALRG